MLLLGNAQGGNPEEKVDVRIGDFAFFGITRARQKVKFPWGIAFVVRHGSLSSVICKRPFKMDSRELSPFGYHGYFFDDPYSHFTTYRDRLKELDSPCDLLLKQAMANIIAKPEFKYAVSEVIRCLVAKGAHISDIDLALVINEKFFWQDQGLTSLQWAKYSLPKSESLNLRVKPSSSER